MLKSFTLPPINMEPMTEGPFKRQIVFQDPGVRFHVNWWESIINTRNCWGTEANILIQQAFGYHAKTRLRNALEGDFVFDDAYAIVQNPDVYSSSPWFQVFWHDFWGFSLLSDKSHKSYRPLTTLTFRLQMSYAGDRADSAAKMMHSLNVFLHSLNSALLVFLFQTFGFRVGESMLGALLFACHPVHIEAVASLVGRAELLAALLSILSLLSHSTPLALVLAGLALLCKDVLHVFCGSRLLSTWKEESGQSRFGHFAGHNFNRGCLETIFSVAKPSRQL